VAPRETVLCGYWVDDGVGDGVELSCEGKWGRMAGLPMLVFEFFIVDAGEQPLANVPIPLLLKEDVAWL